MSKTKQKYQEYVDGVVANHVYHITKCDEAIEKYKSVLRPKERKELLILLMLANAIQEHAIALAESKRVASILFDKELKFNDKVEEYIEVARKNSPVIVIKDVVYTADDIPIDDLVQATINARESVTVGDSGEEN